MNRNTIKRLCKNPWLIGVSLSRRGLLDFLPDKQYIDVMYRARFERKMDWDNPKTFNEKLQWLKLYDRQNIYSVMADKYERSSAISFSRTSESLPPETPTAILSPSAIIS